MRLAQPLQEVRVELAAGLAQQRAREQPAAHADPPMDPPDRQLDPVGQQRVVPSHDMLVDAVDQRPVEIEHQCHPPRRHPPALLLVMAAW